MDAPNQTRASMPRSAMKQSHLNELKRGRENVSVCVEVMRKWTVKEYKGQGKALYIGLVVADTRGNAMYAEISGDAMTEKGHLIEVGKAYIISKFMVSYAKPTYKPFDAKLMLEFTDFTTFDETQKPPRTFPAYIYSITPFNKIVASDRAVAKYTDVIGYVTKDTDVSSFVSRGQESLTVLREIHIKNMSDQELKVTLWGDNATSFNINDIYSEENPKVVVALFVGCIPRQVYNDFNKVYLSGGSACSYYLNPEIKEAEEYYLRFKDQAVYIDRPAPSVAQDPKQTTVTPLQHKTILELNAITDPYVFVDEDYKCTVTITDVPNNNSWWYMACKFCKKKADRQPGGGYRCPECLGSNTIPRYLLTFAAKDETAEATFFAYDEMANQIILEDCQTVLNPLTKGHGLPPQLQAIISKKFTFSVTLTKDSFASKKYRKYQVLSILDRSDRRSSILHGSASAPETSETQAPSLSLSSSKGKYSGTLTIAGGSSSQQNPTTIELPGSSTTETVQTPPPVVDLNETPSKNPSKQPSAIPSNVQKALFTGADTVTEEILEDQTRAEKGNDRDDDDSLSDLHLQPEKKRTKTGSSKKATKGKNPSLP